MGKSSFRIYYIIVVLGLAGCSLTPDPAPAKPTARMAGAPALAGRELGTNAWGLATLSVASGREQPEHRAELGTQVLMGHPVRLLREAGRWRYAETEEGYRAWFDAGSLHTGGLETIRAWTNGPLLVVQAFEEVVRQEPRANAAPVADVVTGNLLRRTGETGAWYSVSLPDGREGFLPREAAENYRFWRERSQATAENIEETACRFLGRPYLWGGTSPKGLDCSGFTLLVFWLNGIDLPRNASQQAREGEAVRLDQNLSHLRRGDLVYFGRRGRAGEQDRVTHIGIYLGDHRFIHSSGRVRFGRLDGQDAGEPVNWRERLLGARRVLKP